MIIDRMMRVTTKVLQRCVDKLLEETAEKEQIYHKAWTNPENCCTAYYFNIAG